jgi:mRNA-degrading endonuclease YafQ of YafQ-DinJ toxin-antitoxin module
MKAVSQTTQFARDVKLMRRRGKDLAKLQAVVQRLAAGSDRPQDNAHRRRVMRLTQEHEGSQRLTHTV